MPQRSGFDSVFIDSSGNPLVNINASVLDGSDNPVSVYEAKTGGAEKSQPITTTSATPGLVRFWAEPGYYQVEISDNELPVRFATRKIPFDAVAGDTSSGSEGISLDQIPTITLDKLPTITAAKLGSESVISGKLKMQNYVVAHNTTSWSSVSPSVHTVAQQTSVAPGIYLAVGELQGVNVAVIGPYFTTSGGTATVGQIASTDRTTGVNGKPLITALVTVSTTTTVELVLGKAGPSGTVTGGLSLFGIAAS